jgi:hypothetical protein
MPAENTNWEELFGEALLEADSQKMPERIVATRQAIAGRLRDLQHDSDHHAERHQIVDALRALSFLEGEAQHTVRNQGDGNWGTERKDVPSRISYELKST